MDRNRKPFGNTTRIGTLLERIEAGDKSAREELINESQERLRRLASKMLSGFPRLRRQGGAETGMVLDDALMGLYNSFGTVEFESPRHFINLAAQKMRFCLLDLARKQKGENGSNAGHVEKPSLDNLVAPDSLDEDVLQPEDWEAFHLAVDRLPEEEKQVFTLRYYGHWSREETAVILGVSEKTVTRKWGRAFEQVAELVRKR